MDRDALYAKQGRNGKFRTQKERDAYLNEEIRAVKETISNQHTQIQNYEEDILEVRRTLDALDEGIQAAQDRMDDTLAGEAGCNSDLEKVRAAIIRLEDEKR